MSSNHYREVENARTQSVAPTCPVTQGPSVLDDAVATFIRDAQRREIFEEGYRRALDDVLASSVFVAEAALRESGDDSAAARRAMYRFIELLEQQTLRRQDESFIAGEGI